MRHFGNDRFEAGEVIENVDDDAGFAPHLGGERQALAALLAGSRIDDQPRRHDRRDSQDSSGPSRFAANAWIS